MAALASRLTLSSLASCTLLPRLPLGAFTLAPLASALNLTLMQSERPLALLRHPYSGPSASGIQSTAFAFHLLSIRPRAPSPLTYCPALCCCLCRDAGPWAAADVVWQAVRSEIQCIIMLSEDIMVEISQSRDVTLGSYQFGSCWVQRKKKKKEAHTVCNSSWRAPTLQKSVLERLTGSPFAFMIIQQRYF